VRSGLFPPKKSKQPLFLNFEIEFSQRKRARMKNNLLQSCFFCDTNKIKHERCTKDFKEEI
jgi:hypothetical protein